MTRALHILLGSEINVKRVTCVNRIRKKVDFELGKEIENEVREYAWESTLGTAPQKLGEVVENVAFNKEILIKHSQTLSQLPKGNGCECGKN